MFRFAKLKEAITHLVNIARVLRKRRIARGKYSGTGTETIGLIIEVATFQGLIYAHVYEIGTDSLWLVATIQGLVPLYVCMWQLKYSPYCIIGGLELEGIEIKVQIGDQNNIEDLIPKKVHKILLY